MPWAKVAYLLFDLCATVALFSGYIVLLYVYKRDSYVIVTDEMGM